MHARAGAGLVGRSEVGKRVKAQTYHLYVQIKDRWRRLCDIEAVDHAQAFQQAMTRLKPEHYTLPIRLEMQRKRATGRPRPPSRGGKRK
jgi:hypothetical protein